MATQTVALAPGDGIGPEIMQATLDLFAAAGVNNHLAFVPIEMGASEFAKGNSRGMSERAVKEVENAGILFKGPMETPKGGGGKSINVTARKLWNAFANFRVFKTLPGVETVYSKAGVKIDMCIVRENIEDTYGGIEHRLSADTFQCKRLISAPGCDQVHDFALRTARSLGLRKIHCGHKANIMKMTDGLFLERFKALAREYPEFEAADVIVDALCMNLVVKPQQYQMIVLPNLQGDIVSDLCAGLVGGLGFAPSANIGHHVSIFEAVHGTAPDIAGKGIANPTSLILSGLMMLRHLGLVREAATIENALLATLESGVHTGDFGWNSGTPAVNTAQFTSAIKSNLGNSPREGAVAVPAANTRGHNRPAAPQGPQVIRTFKNVKAEVVGCDLYIEVAESAGAAGFAPLAEKLQAVAEGTPFRLTLISNRGTQVWPTGSIYTECVDYFRARFEARDGAAPGSITQRAVISLLERATASGYVICEHNLLRTFDGVKGFSLAQGQ